MTPDDIPRLIKEAAEREQRRQADDLRDQYVRILSGIYDKAAAYTQGIVAVAYAAVFGVWAFVRDLMSPKQHALAGLLLLLSAVTFALYEVWTNITSTLNIRSYAHKLRQARQDIVRNMEEFERAQRETDLAEIRVWAVAVVICLITGLAAFAVMVWNLAVDLMGALR